MEHAWWYVKDHRYMLLRCRLSPVVRFTYEQALPDPVPHREPRYTVDLDIPVEDMNKCRLT